MLGDTIFNIMEWIGTISFAISGTLVAISCSLDLFGVITVGCVTAVGGGIIRDLLIGRIPPQIFFNPLILLVALLTSLSVFVFAYFNREKFNSLRERIERTNIFFDALGLAAFSVTGVEIACESAYSGNIVLVITLGTFTGVGGGVLRDVLVNEKPYVLIKHIYAIASILGCVCYYVISFVFGYRVWGTILAVGLTVAVRLLAAKYRWKLPKINLNQ